MTMINSTPSNPLTIAATSSILKTVDLSVQVSDLSIDSDGTVPAPVRQFQIRLGSPSITTPSGAANSLVDLFLTLNLKHPCRTAQFAPQVIPSITSFVYFGPDYISIPPFSYTMNTSTYDCGL